MGGNKYYTSVYQLPYRRNIMDIEIEEMNYTCDAMKLRLQMRKLWTDHAIFTKQLIVDIIDDLPSMNYTIDRLARNQEQTGKCFKSFFGDVASDNLIKLLKEHVTITTDLLKSIKAENADNAATLEDQWTTNIEDISTFLGTINQCYSVDELSDIFKTYLILTKYQFIARMDKDYNAEIMYFDMGLNHILRMSDCLTDGLIENFSED
jgi:hypothetical protein